MAASSGASRLFSMIRNHRFLASSSLSSRSSQLFSVIRNHPFMVSCSFFFFTLFIFPSTSRILLFFSPLLLSTFLCAIIVLSFLPHSGGMEPFVDSDQEAYSSSYSSSLTIAEMKLGNGTIEEIFFSSQEDFVNTETFSSSSSCFLETDQNY